MRLIDMHCDTIFEMFRKGNINLNRNHLCVDLEKLRKADVVAQFFACFIHMEQFHGEDRYAQGYKHGLEMISYAKQQIAKYSSDITLARSYEEFLVNETAGKISAFLTVEEGGIIDGKTENLRELFHQGIRLVTLTWNEENCIGFPNSRDENIMQSGLKPFGMEVVEEMNHLGMIIDVSHLSDGGFWDVLRHSSKPVIASHSNARALCSHPRNLSDEMIRALAEQGGSAGVNLYPYFVNENGMSKVENLIHHIEHMYCVGGEDFIAVGTDFDGFSDGSSQLTNIAQIGVLYEALKTTGFSDRQLEKFWHGNAMRVMKDNL